MIDFMVFAAVVCLLYYALRQRQFHKHLRRLADVEPANGPWPLISVLIPACNEEATAAEAVRSLLRINYPNLEFIFINDRSTDRTGEIIKDLIGSDERARYLEIKELPAGWLGKVNALNEAVKIARGQWLLFTDADVEFATSALQKAMTFAQKNALDLLSAMPEFRARGFFLKLAISAFQQGAAYTALPDRNRDPETRTAVGVGAFILMRRAAYDKTPGLSWLRQEVIEDMGLACMVKRHGGKLELVSGAGELWLSWYPTFMALVKGFEKNMFAAMEYSWKHVAFHVGAVWFLVLGTCVLPFFASPLLQALALAGVLYYMIQASKVLKGARLSPVLALFFPVSMIIFPAIILRSAILCTLQGGINWRGTFYPVASLKLGQRVKVMNLFN